MVKASDSGWSYSVTSSWILPFAQMAGLNWSTCGAGQAGSGVAFSANPATVPCLLIWLAAPLLPPSVGSAVIAPSCHKNGRQELPAEGSPSALKPQESSPFGSKVDVSASPTAWPVPLRLNATVFAPPSPGLEIGRAH